MDAPPSQHPTDQTLRSYGSGNLDNRSAEAVNKHLEHCPDCRKRVAELSADNVRGRVRDAQAGAKSTSGNSQTGGTADRKGSRTAAPPPADTLPPGLADQPDYEIKQELGRGGMGVVYLAHNTLMGRDEVLKVMGRQIMERPGVFDRFLREIRAIAKLRHPNIVTAYSAVRIGESIVFAMEYVEGLDLSKMVKAKGPLPVGHACNFAYQAALGLQHAHEEGLVHRDIKPANLMLSKKGDKASVKVLDFGLAKVTREEKIDGGLTSEGQALGTPDYIAPEQILDAQGADIRADIYSLGGTLYYLLTGRPPFRANSLYDIYQAHISRDADPLNLVRPEVPAELAALVTKMMAKDPARRFQTPDEVAQALTPFFKKGKVAFKSPPADGPPDGHINISCPANQPVTETGGPAVRPKKATEPTVPEGRWESLIDFREAENSIEATPAVAPMRQTRGVWPSVAAGVLMFGLIGAWLSSAFKVETPEGMIVVENGPSISAVPPRVETIAPPIRQDDLVAFYDFTDDAVADRSGHGNDINFTRPPTFTSQGYQGGALAFDARQKNLATIPVNINPSMMPQITMGGWFNSNADKPGPPLLLHDNGGWDRTLNIDVRGGSGVQWAAFKGSGVLGGASVTPWKWTFIVLRHDQSTGELTLNVDEHKIRARAHFGRGFDVTTLGGSRNYNQWFDGRIDNIFIYRRVLGMTRSRTSGLGAGTRSCRDRSRRTRVAPTATRFPENRPGGPLSERLLPGTTWTASLTRGQ